MKEGDKFQERFIVSEKVYQGFREIFQDNNPLHTQPDFARQKGFKDVVMQGNILNGFLSYFIGECLPIKEVAILTQEIKFSRPVYLNDALDLHAEAVEVYDSVKTVVLKFVFENAAKEKVAKGKIQIGLI